MKIIGQRGTGKIPKTTSKQNIKKVKTPLTPRFTLVGKKIQLAYFVLVGKHSGEVGDSGTPIINPEYNG